MTRKLSHSAGHASLAMILAMAIFSSEANAAAPQCYPNGGTGFCQYNGKVTKAYMNAYDEILLYFDAPVDAGQAAAVGLTGVSVTVAAKYNMAGNKDFGKSLFAALLAAQARGASVEVQLHTVSGGYLIMDRVWVLE